MRRPSAWARRRRELIPFVVRKPLPVPVDRPSNSRPVAPPSPAGWIVAHGPRPRRMGPLGQGRGDDQRSGARGLCSVWSGSPSHAAAEFRAFRRMSDARLRWPSFARAWSRSSRASSRSSPTTTASGIMLFVLVATTFPMVSEALWNEGHGRPALLQRVDAAAWAHRVLPDGHGYAPRLRRPPPGRSAGRSSLPPPRSSSRSPSTSRSARSSASPPWRGSEGSHGGVLGLRSRRSTPSRRSRLLARRIQLCRDRRPIPLPLAAARATVARTSSRFPKPVRPILAFLLFRAGRSASAHGSPSLWRIHRPPRHRPRMFLGFTGKSWTVDKETTMAPNQTGTPSSASP